MEMIDWADFERVEIRVGTVIAAEPFPEARKPAYRLRIDFGEQLGERTSSARLLTCTSRTRSSGARSWRS